MKYMWIGLLAMFGVGLLMLPSGIHLGAAGTDAGQQMKDRAEIDALMWRYVRALDSLDPDGYSGVYTPDGVFGSGPSVTKGGDALKKMIADIKSGQAARLEKGETAGPMYHVITNESVEFPAKDQAVVRAYWMTVFGGAARGEQARVAAVGRSIDQLVKVNGKWLIKSRNVNPGASE